MSNTPPPATSHNGRYVTPPRSPLRVVACKPECFTITNGGALDPVLVILQDFGHGRGRITLECYGKAWSAYWGATGGLDLRSFIAATSDDYVVTNLVRSLDLPQRKRKVEEAYLSRIVAALRLALQMPVEPAP